MKLNFNGIMVNADDNVTKNFKYREFQCKDGSSKVIMSEKTINKLQELRDWLGVPIQINSAYRHLAYNRKVGSSDDSQHVEGTAVDIYVKGVDPMIVAAYGQALGFTGIGVYPPNSKQSKYGFTHLDTRRKVARWGSYQGINNIKLKPKKEKEDDLVFEDIKVRNKINNKEVTARVLVEDDGKGNRVQSIKFDDLRALGINVDWDNKAKVVVINE